MLIQQKTAQEHAFYSHTSEHIIVDIFYTKVHKFHTKGERALHYDFYIWIELDTLQSAHQECDSVQLSPLIRFVIKPTLEQGFSLMLCIVVSVALTEHVGITPLQAQ